MNLQFLNLPTYPQDLEAKTTLPTQDLVSMHWEGELLQFIIRHYLPKDTNKFRCLSIGDRQDSTFLAMSKIKNEESRLQTIGTYVISENNWELFMALNTDSEAVEALNHVYRDQKKVRFFRHDYRKGLGLFKYEAPFDWYWLGTQATQHSDTQNLTTLLTEICKHAQPKSIICLDFLGYNSVTQGWDWQMVKELLATLPTDEGWQARVLQKIDRTAMPTPVRDAMNSLLTQYVRTDLKTLYLKSETQTPLTLLQNCWNALVHYAILKFEANSEQPEDFEDWEIIPAPLKFALKNMQRFIQDTDRITYGDVRANMLEPHLAYVLRNLEYELQNGTGAGQYFTVLLQIQQDDI